MYCNLENILIQRTVIPVRSSVALLFSFYLQNLQCVGALEPTFLFQPKWQCANGTSVREEQRLAAAFTLCALSLVRLGGCEEGGADVAATKQRDGRWPLGVTEKVRGLQGNEPWILCPENIQDGNSLFDFLGVGWGGGVIYVSLTMSQVIK